MIIYAIGDIHGEADRLNTLHGHITETHGLLFAGEPAQIIYLGDYIDRGPDSFAVIETIREFAKRPGFETITLQGNHEEMMLEGLTRPGDEAFWLRNGGDATLESYRRHGHETPPQHHVDWLKACLPWHVDPENRLIFVHAGIDPSLFPGRDTNANLWTRSKRFFDPARWNNPALDGWRVVHGHTPTSNNEPEIAGALGQRINIDTGAVYGGRLTAARFAPGEPVTFLHA